MSIVDSARSELFKKVKLESESPCLYSVTCTELGEYIDRADTALECDWSHTSTRTNRRLVIDST